MLNDGGEIFGRAVTDPTLHAETILGQILICLQGGQKFLVNMLSVAKNERNFLSV